MKFYDCAPAPSPRRVRIYLAEKGLEMETVQVDLGNGEQMTEVLPGRQSPLYGACPRT